MIFLLIVLFGCFLAYANGANDNFKGVATLFGSGTTDYKNALTWATGTTFLGSATALIIAHELIIKFTGKGLLPEDVIATKTFPISVALAAACAVMLATKFGFPVSTTHALIGSLVGAGLIASPSHVNFVSLGKSFFLPLLISPFLAMMAAVSFYPLFRWARVRLRVGKETCLCIGTEIIATFPQSLTQEQALVMFDIQAIPSLSLGTMATCRERYTGTVFGIGARPMLDFFHLLSSGAVSFARGLNDTPKITALLLAGSALSPSLAIGAVAMVMALGGLVNSKKVAETLSHRITSMNAGQGFSANLVTSAIVILASKFGMPVSTTHVSCGALFGLGAVTKQGHWKTIGSIFIAWISTLPLAALLGAAFFYLLERMPL